jgi:uncharacterized protein (TIRG00374 family)
MSRRLMRLGGRAALLLVTGLSLYVLFPSLVSVFSSWRTLSTIDWFWAQLMVIAEALSFVAIWRLQRIALQERKWFPVATSQLSSNAFGRIVPGGGATAGAFQIGMLRRAGLEAGRVGAALAAGSGLQFAALLSLPVLAVPAIIAGAPVDRSLTVAAFLGVGALVLLLAAGATAFAWDRPLIAVGRAAQWVFNRTLRRKHPVSDLPSKLLVERTFIRSTLGAHWRAAVITAAAVPTFDYLALLLALRAVGAQPRPSLVLLAYVSAALLGMIPLTPGGLGFVEAGLVGTLTLAGVDAGAAVTATLAYRLAAFWLPIPIGGVAYLLFRRRYGATTPRTATLSSTPRTGEADPPRISRASRP